LRKVAESSKSRINQALAIKSLINLNERMSQMADKMDDEAFRKAMMEEGQLTEADIKEMVANGDARAKETVVLKDRLKKDFSDIFPDLSIGQPAPETVGHDLDGNEDRLSGYKGKVVVLDVWTTWCGPCRQMIPHEREMVERLSGKPFALISVSMDDEQEALTEFLKENEMPWKHWWCGGDRSFSLKWDIQYFPTIYVIDATGKIRFKDVREEKLEEAVNELLEEIEQGESGDSAGNDG
jgi:thiol-disulfide isomerase/thioredoxin